MSDNAHKVELLGLLRLDTSDAVRSKLEEMPVQDIAAVVGEATPAQQLQILHALPDERRTDTFSYLGHGLQRTLLERLEADEARRILHELVPDDRTALLESLDPESLENLLKLMGPEDLKQSLKLLGYPEESIGRLMTTRFVSVRPQWAVTRALDHIRHEADRGETVNHIFVTDDRGKLLDVLKLKDFILARQNAEVETLLDHEVISAEASADREQAVRIIQHYDINTLAVTDRHGVLLGIVTVDDVMDVAEKETTEDFHKMGSVGVTVTSLREASPLLLYRKRIGWLMILILVNLFSGAAIAYFENAIETVMMLIFFLPVVIASGGNAGSQAATLMVRALATGDVQMRDWFRMWGKELVVALALGLTIGLVVSMVGLWHGGRGIALVLATSLTAVVVVGSMLGMLLPFILTRFRMDPATASTPLITSVADVAGILIYFSVAAVLLHLPLGG